MTSVLDKFNPYAMIKPVTKEDFTLLLQEALSIAEDINEILEQVATDCQKDQDEQN